MSLHFLSGKKDVCDQKVFVVYIGEIESEREREREIVCFRIKELHMSLV